MDQAEQAAAGLDLARQTGSAGREEVVNKRPSLFVFFWAKCLCMQLSASSATQWTCRSAALGFNVVGAVKSYIGCGALGYP